MPQPQGQPAPTPSEHDRANARPPTRPATAAADRAVADSGNRTGREPAPDAPPGASPEFSTTARFEAIPVPRPATQPDDQKAAESKLAPLQKDYESTLNEIRETPDPLARAQLVVKKGNLVRQMDTIRRPARLAAPDLPPAPAKK